MHESSAAPSLLSYTLRYVNLAELGHVCQFGLREPMHLCMRERGGLSRVSDQTRRKGAYFSAYSVLVQMQGTRFLTITELHPLFNPVKLSCVCVGHLWKRGESLVDAHDLKKFVPNLRFTGS